MAKLVSATCLILASGCWWGGPSESVADVRSRGEVVLEPPKIPDLSDFRQRADGGLVADISSDILFDHDSDVLRAEAEEVIAHLAPRISSHRGAVEVTGYADGVGSRTHNLGLSKRRAAAVVSLLIESFGVDPARVVADGVGERGAANDLADPERRKVEIVLLP